MMVVIHLIDNQYHNCKNVDIKLFIHFFLSHLPSLCSGTRIDLFIHPEFDVHKYI